MPNYSKKGVTMTPPVVGGQSKPAQKDGSYKSGPYNAQSEHQKTGPVPKPLKGK
jgi:hypothetical protein